MSAYIQKLIAQGEHLQLDFKFEISDSKKIARSLVAFANTEGGKLLVGVKDNGVVAGVRSEEEYYMVEAAAQMYCRPQIEFATREWDVDGKKVLEIDIPKSNSGPYSAPDKDGKWMVYIRVHDQNLLANTVLLKVWQMKKRKKELLSAIPIRRKCSSNTLIRIIISLSQSFRELLVFRVRWQRKYLLILLLCKLYTWILLKNQLFT